MVKYINRSQLQNASDEEILEFFSQITFHGVYSSEIKSIQKADYYKGQGWRIIAFRGPGFRLASPHQTIHDNNGTA